MKHIVLVLMVISATMLAGPAAHKKKEAAAHEHEQGVKAAKPQALQAPKAPKAAAKPEHHDAPTSPAPSHNMPAPVSAPSTDVAAHSEQTPTPETPAQTSSSHPEAKKKAAAVDYGEGIDTLDVLSGGNWLQKRVIWEDAQKEYEKIKALFNQVLEARISFYDKRSQSTRDLNVFFAEIGTSRGALTDEIGELLAKLDQTQAETGALSEEERNLRVKLQEKKRDLEQLGTDLHSLAEFDTALDTALSQMMHQISLAADYDRQAWQRFKDIGQELDDYKAKAYFAHMLTCKQNLQNILDYFHGVFSQYLDTVVHKMDELRSNSKTQIEALQREGLDLTKKLSEVQEAERKAREAKALQEQEEQERLARVKKKSWYNNVSFLWEKPATWAQSAWKGVCSTSTKAWNWTTSWFGKKVAKPTAQNAEHPTDQSHIEMQPAEPHLDLPTSSV